MSIPQEFTTLPLDRLRDMAHRMKDEGWRFIQTHAVYNEPNVDLYYSFMKDGAVRNWRIEGVTKDDPVPSITDIFLAAFVFENEARELFGVDMRNIAIDFQGALYAPAEREPMRVITPEQKAAIEKARKAAAAKAAKGEAAANAPETDGAAQTARGTGFVMTPEKREKLEAKLATMSPDKVAKVRAALAAREAEAAAVPQQQEKTALKAETPQEKGGAPATDDAPRAVASESQEEKVSQGPARDDDLEAKIALLDSEKAAKVKAAMAAHASGESCAEEPATEPVAKKLDDAELESKLGMMDKEKADLVREALARRASTKGGE